jgi:hypothetical protein
VVISQSPGDKARISGLAAQQRTRPQIIPSAKIRWKISCLDFFGTKLHPPH